MDITQTVCNSCLGIPKFLKYALPLFFDF